MKTTIALEGMIFRAHHGVMPQERSVGNTFIVDLRYEIDTNAVSSDRIEDTVSYADIYALIHREMDVPSQLLEHVAGRMLHQLQHTYPQLKAITLTLKKKAPPVAHSEIEYASVTLYG